jgi:hypothetical protein
MHFCIQNHCSQLMIYYIIEPPIIWFKLSNYMLFANAFATKQIQKIIL